MSSIRRASGTTTSERYLAWLAEHSFLDLWSYPNVYRDVPIRGGQVMGKEVCDLLVVCGDHVLIFSDKTVGWPKHADSSAAWSRRYRHARPCATENSASRRFLRRNGRQIRIVSRTERRSTCMLGPWMRDCNGESNATAGTKRVKGFSRG